MVENFEFACFDDFEKWVRVRFDVTNSEKLMFKNQDGTGLYRILHLNKMYS